MRILLLLFFFSISKAQILIESGITHGGEIEFTSDWIHAVDLHQRKGKLRGREWPAARAMARVVGQKCKTLGCKVLSVDGKWGKEYRVQLNSGWWFQISYDPLCVEIQTKPATLQELYLNQEIAQDLIFDSAAKAGLEVKPNRATHMNTGARSAFGYDLRNLFNYFVDNANHPEFSSGVFRKNWNTAPPLVLSHPDAEPVINSIREKIENKKINSFSQLAKEIIKNLHSTFLSSQFNPRRNQDLSFRKLVELNESSALQNSKEIDVPFERRGVRAVRSFQEFILHAEMIESRIAWVNAQSGWIPFVSKKATDMTTDQKADFFKQWLSETGLSESRYLPVIKETPSFHSTESQNSCLRFYSI